MTMGDMKTWEEWRVRSHCPNGKITEAVYSERRTAELETYFRQVYSACKVELLAHRTITATDWTTDDVTS